MLALLHNICEASKSIPVLLPLGGALTLLMLVPRKHEIPPTALVGAETLGNPKEGPAKSFSVAASRVRVGLEGDTAHNSPRNKPNEERKASAIHQLTPSGSPVHVLNAVKPPNQA